MIEELVAAADPGLVGIQSPRYFGFVIGGGLDAAIAADWLATVWDQNAAGYPGGPSAAVVEEVACEWLLDLLGLPEDAGVGLTTGCQMAHFTCLAAARHRALADVGWDVEAEGLFGAPPIRVLVGARAHTTVFAALRMLGLGSRRVELVAADGAGSDARVRARPHAVRRGRPGHRGRPGRRGQHRRNRRHRQRSRDSRANTMPGVTWMARSGCGRRLAPRLRGLIDGVAWADSWATDAHKWLNVPYDCGVAIVRDRAAHTAAMNSFAGAEYIPPPQHDERYPAEWVPEFSRRARGFAVYAALRELGRSGVSALVERCCACARLMAEELERDPRATVLNDVVLNQVLVRFTCDGANVTDEVIDAVQREGTCWMSGTEWDGGPAMRISVCNWRTNEDDIRRSASAIRAQVGIAERASA